MRNDDVLRSMPEDMKFFIYQEVPLAYSPETGMCWKARKDGSWNLVTPGLLNKGYTQLRIGAKRVQLHRLLAEVFLNNGKPLTDAQHVDHAEQVDGSHWQDRLSNLRICSSKENSRNRKLGSHNTSGYKGIFWDAPRSKWLALITISGKRKHLGCFTTPEAAAQAYDAAAIRYFGEFSLTNAKLGLLSYATFAPA